MMDTPLTINEMLERAENYFPKKEVISRTHNSVQRCTYEETGKRTRALARALEKLGEKKGDRVGTLAWKHHRQLEVKFADPTRSAGLHTIDMRLSAVRL